jgi:acyl-CoA synthetase (NDP forming)
MTWDPALETAFHPKVVAMVGISSNAQPGVRRGPGGANFITSYEQLGFKGHIHPVNPKATEIMGRKAYPTVASIPEPVDLVIVSVPAPALPAVLEDCITANAKNIHVFTAGFEETGETERIALGHRVREIAERGGLRIIGPNCMGLYIPASGVGSFDRLPSESGPVAFISQSGGHLNWFSHYGQNYGIRFSKAISFGNAYVIDSTDYLEYFATDPDTSIICMYLEGVKDGRKLLRQVRAINRTKPVILWKAGLTEDGTRAVASHTASLAGQEGIWRGFFAQTGAVPVHSLEEMAEMAMTFLYVKKPPGKRVSVIGLGGGTSVASADVCNREGLDVPALTEEIQVELKKFIPIAGSSVRNPLDTGLVFRNINDLRREVELVTADPNIDMLILRPHLDMVSAGDSGDASEVIDYLIDICRNNPRGKPVVLVFHSFSNDPQEFEMRSRLQVELPGKGIPVYLSLNAACRALFRLYEYHRLQKELVADEG